MTHAVRPLADRPLDIVLFGATGFTGKLVAEYFAKRRIAPSRWAIAGRSANKLEAVRTELVAIDPALAALSIRVADAHDKAALAELVADARVVCTTVGPFDKYGRELARACAKAGTSYCNITGETPFVRWTIDELDALANETHARIVHCCGYDSIPFDLGVHFVWDEAKRRGESGLAWAKGFAGRTKGGFSGGTVATIVDTIDQAMKDPPIRKVLGNLHALEPGVPRSHDPFEQDRKGVAFDSDLGRWTAPFIMSAINTRIVRRSNALVGYGKSFRYAEAMSMPKGPKGLAMASAITAGIGVFFGALAFRPTRKLLERTLLPAPGEGPSREAREAGHFEAQFVAECESGTRLRGRVTGKGDPGYDATARMLGESALCLAENEAELPRRFGSLTPASAMGMHLVERLRSADMTFTIED